MSEDLLLDGQLAKLFLEEGLELPDDTLGAGQKEIVHMRSKE